MRGGGRGGGVSESFDVQTMKHGVITKSANA